MSLANVAELVDDLVARAVFRAHVEIVADHERAWRIVWFGGHTMQFVARVRGEQSTIEVRGVIPLVSAQSRLYRELRQWCYGRQSPTLPDHRRLDGDTVSLGVRNSRGRTDLRLTSSARAAHILANESIQLVNALYHEVLGEPQHMAWVADAFGLDPDNPRLR